MKKKYLVMMATVVRYSVVSVEMDACSEEQAWTLGTEEIKSGKQLEVFEINLIDATGNRKKIAQDLMKIGSVYAGQEKQKASEWARNMMVDGNF